MYSDNKPPSYAAIRERALDMSLEMHRTYGTNGAVPNISMILTAAQEFFKFLNQKEKK